MKAAVFYGKEDVRIEERPMPVAGPNQLVVKMNYCAICGSDMDRWRHGTDIPIDYEKGMVLGHEKVGTVYQVGEGVTKFKVGDRLLLGPPSFCPEMCPSCRRGETNTCLHGLSRTPGIGGPDGGFAEYMLVEDVEHSILIKIPETTDLKDAVLFDIYCVAFHAVRRSNVKIGDCVVVSGVGGIGMAAISILRAAGVRKLIALGTSPEKFPTLYEYGADLCINPNTCEDLEGEIKKFFGREVGADVTFECAGNNISMENCVYRCTRPGGQVVTVGGIIEPLTLIQDWMNLHEIDLRTTFAFTEEDALMYVSLLNDKKLYVGDNMISKIISLDELVEEGLSKKVHKGVIRILVDLSL